MTFPLSCKNALLYFIKSSFSAFTSKLCFTSMFGNHIFKLYSQRILSSFEFDFCQVITNALYGSGLSIFTNCSTPQKFTPNLHIEKCPKIKMSSVMWHSIYLHSIPEKNIHWSLNLLWMQLIGSCNITEQSNYSLLNKVIKLSSFNTILFHIFISMFSLKETSPYILHISKYYWLVICV